MKHAKPPCNIPVSFAMNELPPKPPRLLDQIREGLRLRHYSLLTEQASIGPSGTSTFMASAILAIWEPRRWKPSCLTSLSRAVYRRQPKGRHWRHCYFCTSSVEHRQARQYPHTAAFLRDPFAGIRAGYSHGARATGPRGCEDHDDLYPCVESRSTGRRQPVGSVARSAVAAGAALKQGKASA